MTNTRITKRKTHFNLIALALLLILSLGSCEKEEADLPPVVDTAAFISQLTGGDSKAWKIETAILRNTALAALDVTSEYTIADDIFVISSSSDLSIDLKWERGLTFRPGAGDLASFNTDERLGSIKETLAYLGRDNAFRNSASDYYLEYDEVTEKIAAVIFLEGDAKLEIVLSEKRAQDYLQSPQSLNTTSLLFELPRSSLWAGMKYSRSNNVLFLNTPSLPWTGMNLEILTAAYNTSSEVLTTNQFIEVNDHPWTNLEVIDDIVYNVGGSKIQAFDTSFSSPISEFSITVPGPPINVLEYGSSSIDGDIYIFGGTLSDFNVSQIGVFTPGVQNAVQILKTLPVKMPFADGEIVGDNLYIFGGFSGADNGPNPNNYKYNLLTGELTSFEMPVAISFTSTAVVQNLIYIAGRRSLDIDGDGTIDQVSYLASYDTTTGVFTEIPLDFITEPNEQIYKVDATEDRIYTGFWINNSGTENDSFRVYASEI